MQNTRFFLNNMLNYIGPKYGPLAHLVEHLLCKQGVAGSSPVGSTKEKSRGLSALIFLFISKIQPTSMVRKFTSKLTSGYAKKHTLRKSHSRRGTTFSDCLCFERFLSIHH